MEKRVINDLYLCGTSNSPGSHNVYISNIQKPQRSPAIPKEVNSFVLKNYGAAYYNTYDFVQRKNVLNQVQEQLKKAGYDISQDLLERRLKNMKSHYRLKRKDLELGVVTSIDWEYYQALDNIFKLAKKDKDADCTTKPVATADVAQMSKAEQEVATGKQADSAQKRKSEAEVKPAVCQEPNEELKPQDL